MEITNGEVDILLKIKKIKEGYARLKYIKIKGTIDNFELFKKRIKSLKEKDCWYIYILDFFMYIGKIISQLFVIVIIFLLLDIINVSKII